MHILLFSVHFNVNFCYKLGPYFDPWLKLNEENYECNPDDHTTCFIGDLNGKFGGLNFETTETQTLTFEDHTFDIIDVRERYVAIYDANGEVIDCASIEVQGILFSLCFIQISDISSCGDVIIFIWGTNKHPYYPRIYSVCFEILKKSKINEKKENK